MGDMADFSIDQLVLDTWGIRPRKQSVYGPPLTCRHCGSSDVYWQKVKGEYRIYSQDTVKLHRCPVTPLGALPDDDE